MYLWAFAAHVACHALKIMTTIPTCPHRNAARETSASGPLWAYVCMCMWVYECICSSYFINNSYTVHCMVMLRLTPRRTLLHAHICLRLCMNLCAFTKMSVCMRTGSSSADHSAAQSFAGQTSFTFSCLSR